MRAKRKALSQLNFLAPTLTEQLNPSYPLYLLPQEIDWDYFEAEFSSLYSDKGRPAHSIRLMTSLLQLKSIYNLSDEKLVEEHWEMNVYFQYFSGGKHQQWGQPCAASDLVHFRQRIGEVGVEKILKHSIDKHGKDGEDPHVSIDSTAQEKNITYPTDAKLHKKIIDKCVKKVKKENMVLRRSYKRTSKQLLRDTYNGSHPKRCKKVAIEPIIGHLKTEHRAARNFLKGQIGDSINFTMAAAGFNFRKLMVKLQEIKLWLSVEINLINYRDLFSYAIVKKQSRRQLITLF